jgi:archaellum component FlaC
MKDLLNRVADNLDKLDDKLDGIDKTLVKQEENLREHMRRTEILESQHRDLKIEIHDEIKPIKSHVEQVKGISKFLIVIIPIIAIISGAIYKYIKT